MATTLIALGFLVCCSLARQLVKDFYRPWLTQRLADDRAWHRDAETPWDSLDCEALASLSDKTHRQFQKHWVQYNAALDAWDREHWV